MAEVQSRPGKLARLLQAGSARLHAVFLRLDRASGGRLALLQSALNSYHEARAGEAAASIAYYSLFSLFPLLLFLLAGLTYILERDTAQRQLLAYIDILLPVSQSLVFSYLDRILVESEAPFMVPAEFRGKRNKPEYLPSTVRFLAELLEMPEEETANALWENAKRFFRIP